MKRVLNKNQAAAATVVVFFLLVAAIGVSFYLGSAAIDPSQLFNSDIFWQIRFPRVILAALVGMLLSISGVVLQGVLRNPLADPYILGVSAGGAIGAAIAIAFGVGVVVFGMSSVPALAFLFSLAAVVMVYQLSKVSGRTAPETLVLAGVALSAFCSAILALIIILTGNLASIYFWLLGSLSSASWTQVYTVIPYALIGGGIAYFFSKELNAFLLGEEMALTLGVDVERVKLILIAAASLMTAAAVSVSGLIGFVGLIVPHFIRLLVGSNHRFLIPLSTLTGMLLMVVADAIARTVIAPQEVPIGVVMALVGSPFFLYLLRRRRRGER
ncbi:MAG: iron ABC transporter permease [Candidatus Margulisiibacteriota bacterium]